VGIWKVNKTRYCL